MTIDELLAISNIRRLLASGEFARMRLRVYLHETEIAQAIGVNPSTVSRWERGEASPRAAHALALAKMLPLLPPPPDRW